MNIVGMICKHTEYGYQITTQFAERGKVDSGFQIHIKYGADRDTVAAQLEQLVFGINKLALRDSPNET